MLCPKTETLTAHRDGDLLYYGFPQLDALPFIRHGFSTRLGGVSEEVYTAMNLSFGRGDDPERVSENFRRQCEAMGVTADRVVLSKQTHTVRIQNVTGADAGNGVTGPQRYEDIDGLLTDEPNVVLCTQHADCVPLFLVDPVRRVIGLSHSGWRGTANRMAAVTVERMNRDYGCRPDDLLAGIGPSIGPCCFEVGEDVAAVFEQMPETDETCFGHRGEKATVNLWEINRRLLCEAGVAASNITVTDLCTACHPDVFWSHRVQGKNRGSLAAFLAMK